jgi:hypothetical protein
MEEHANGGPRYVKIVAGEKVEHSGDNGAGIGEVPKVLIDRPFFEATPVELEVEGDDEGRGLRVHEFTLM